MKKAECIVKQYDNYVAEQVNKSVIKSDPLFWSFFVELLKWLFLFVAEWNKHARREYRRQWRVERVSARLPEVGHQKRTRYFDFFDAV